MIVGARTILTKIGDTIFPLKTVNTFIKRIKQRHLSPVSGFFMHIKDLAFHVIISLSFHALLLHIFCLFQLWSVSPLKLEQVVKRNLESGKTPLNPHM